MPKACLAEKLAAAEYVLLRPKMYRPPIPAAANGAAKTAICKPAAFKQAAFLHGYLYTSE